MSVKHDNINIPSLFQFDGICSPAVAERDPLKRMSQSRIPAFRLFWCQWGAQCFQSLERKTQRLV